MKKLRLTLIGAVIIIVLSSFENVGDISSQFWGWSYGTPSGTMQEGGTGNCYQEVNAQHFIFWIGGSVQQKYRYVDCGNGSATGEWSNSLMGSE